MGSKNSPSSTSSTTSKSESKDQKQTAGNAEVLLQQAEGAELLIDVQNSFSDNEVDVFKELANIANNAMGGAERAYDKSLNSVIERYENQESDLARLSESTKPIIIGGVVLGGIYFISKAVK